MELNAVVAAVLIPLLRLLTVDFMAFQPEEITFLMPPTTSLILLLIADQIEETTAWIAESTVEMTVWIAFQAVVILVWIPVSSGDKNDTMAFHTVVTAVWIAVSTVEIAVWIAVQTVLKVVCSVKNAIGKELPTIIPFEDILEVTMD